MGRYYLGPFAFISYLIAAIFAKYKLKLVEWLLILVLFFTAIIAFFLYGLSNVLNLYIFHWGFIFYFLFFKNFRELFNNRKIFFTLIFISIIEGILVNTIVDPTLLPNYPSYEKSSHFTNLSLAGGTGFQRALSFGGNASVTGVLIVALFTTLPFSKLKLFVSSIAIVFVASGSGFLSFILSIYSSLKKLKNWALITLLSIVSTLGIFFINIFFKDVAKYFYKGSFYYLSFLFNQKLERVYSTLDNMDFNQIIFGSLNYFDAGGDFSSLGFFKCHGIVGLIIITLFVCLNLSSKNRFPIFLIILFTFHYHIVFSTPGQLIFGFLLSLKNEKDFKKIEIKNY